MSGKRTGKKSRALKALARRALGYGVGAIAAGRGAYKQYAAEKMLRDTQKWSDSPAGEAFRKKRAAALKSRQMAKRVRQLETKLAGTTGLFTYRQRDTSHVEIPTNQSLHKTFPVNGTTDFGQVLSEVPRFNPATNTMETKDFNATNYSRHYLFKVIQSTMWLNNNGRIPVRVKVYCCRSKSDTSIDPATAISNGIVDQMLSPQTLSGLLFPTDVNLFKELWEIKKMASVYLHPGKPMFVTYAEKDVAFDPAFIDSHGFEYTTNHRSYVWMIRLEGVVSHSPDNPLLVGSAPGCVDVQIDKKFELEYDSGQSDTKFYRFVDNSDATGDGVVGTAVNANQSFTNATGV